MKKLLLIPFLFFTIIGYTQVMNFGGVGFRVNDSTTYRASSAVTAAHTAGYRDIYFNNQATTKHWDVWNGSSYDHVFSFGEGSGGSGHTIEDEGTPLTTRTKLNFVGAGVTVTDDSGDDATVVTISGGGGAGTVNSGTQYRIAHYATAGTAISEAAAITAGRALKSDANGVPTHFDTATEPSLTELSYVKGVTSAVQTQLDGKAPLGKYIQRNFSDQSSTITATTGKITFRMPFAMTVTAVRVSLKTAQTSGSIFTVDIHESGTTILSTKITLDNTEKTSTTATTAPVISDSSLADDAEITVDVDQIGDGTAIGGVITIIGY